MLCGCGITPHIVKVAATFFQPTYPLPQHHHFLSTSVFQPQQPAIPCFSFLRNKIMSQRTRNSNIPTNGKNVINNYMSTHIPPKSVRTVSHTYHITPPLFSPNLFPFPLYSQNLLHFPLTSTFLFTLKQSLYCALHLSFAPLKLSLHPPQKVLFSIC